MAELGAEHGIEVSLFLGPRGAWDTGGQSFAAGSAGGVARGQAGVEACLAEVRRGLGLGIRSFLVADTGVLATLGRLKRDGDLPAVARPQDLGAAPVRESAHRPRSRGAGRDHDQRRHRPLGRRARRDPHAPARRRSTSTSRFRTIKAASCATTTCRRSSAAAAPVYVKLGLRNAPNIYPSGLHLEDLAVRLGRERVRRAELVLRLVRELAPELIEGRGADRPPDLGVPEP